MCDVHIISAQPDDYATLAIDNERSDALVFYMYDTWYEILRVHVQGTRYKVQEQKGLSHSTTYILHFRLPHHTPSVVLGI